MTNLDAGTVGEEGLRALRVVERSMANTPPRSPNGEVSTVKQVARTIAVLGCFVNNLEIDQIHLYYTWGLLNEIKDKILLIFVKLCYYK